MDSAFINDFRDKKILEKYSSAFTLSDMEIFIFPELFYPLVLANIMSPIIWKWRDDPWFKDIEKKSFTNKSNRIKQFIIQNYVFNLDLSTWGLTTKTNEIARFSEYFDMEHLRQSNALFGYEGDKYYFDIDIRKHFGLDKFDSDIIPYWKTETVEAMTAFMYKKNFTTGAGECVSLSSLYAAAMFIVGRIPLEKIFLIATPLHSQNFVIEKDGLLTNNRRIVTKNMWFNGTSLSDRARRALENEKVTIVSHISGYIHTLYNEATINRKSYHEFSQKLRKFLVTDLTDIIFVNFLRVSSNYKKLFQYRCNFDGHRRFIGLDKMFEYEHSSKFNVSSDTRERLIKEIEEDEFHLSPLQGRIMLNDIESLLIENKSKNLQEIEHEFIKYACDVPEELIHKMFGEIGVFIHTDPKLPSPEKKFTSSEVPDISIDDSRTKIVNKILGLKEISESALLALYIYRQMDIIDWLPFIKASIERNPVCFKDLNSKSVGEVYHILSEMENHSIYDEIRLALPDEVWNFRRGDGIEKAILLADFIMKSDGNSLIAIDIDDKIVTMNVNGSIYTFTSSKSLKKSISISEGNYSIN
jgi:hypothetical protein